MHALRVIFHENSVMFVARLSLCIVDLRTYNAENQIRESTSTLSRQRVMLVGALRHARSCSFVTLSKALKSNYWTSMTKPCGCVGEESF
jgi:hypothetical protein